MRFHQLWLLSGLVCSPIIVQGQVTFSGRTLDAGTGVALPDVYIRLSNKGNIRSVSSHEGMFKLTLQESQLNDTLVCSLLGYEDARLPLSTWKNGDTADVPLKRKVTVLHTAEVSSALLRERKYGIRKRGFPLHFTDGIFEWKGPFEIAQVIRLGSDPKRITSTHLYITNSQADSATFLINFYQYANRQPGARILKNDIRVRLPLQKGWLKFDLMPFGIYLRDSVVASIRFLPVASEKSPFNYEIKLGGASRSYYRRAESDSWHTAPHHYCMYVSALAKHSEPEAAESEASLPLFTLYSRHVKDSFSIFLHKAKQHSPVLFVLDANAYFDQCRQLLSDRKLADKITLVGIGYGNAYLMDSLRIRDYTFPKAPEKDSLPNTGGGKAFLDFIKTELMPYLREHYAVDTGNNTLMGHSFGGYFVLYALLNDRDHTFSRYVAASPSLHYADGYMLKTLPAMDHITGKKLLITFGEQEVPGADDLDRLTEALHKKGANAGYKIYPALEHMETVIPTLEDAISDLPKF